MTTTIEMCGGECTTVLDDSGRAIININHGPRMEEVHRESQGERWCFSHRGRSEFFYVVTAPVTPSYYGPNPAIICGQCGQHDADLGFGRYREWE